MLAQPAGNPGSKSIFANDFCEIIEYAESGAKALFALKSYQPEEVISPFSASYVSRKPSYLTVQIGLRKHITLLPQFLQYINHSCAPNAFFDTTAMQLIALRPIEPGDEITFFYPSTEWDMAQPFQCLCGHPECLGTINGASALPREVLGRYRVSAFVLSMVNSE